VVMNYVTREILLDDLLRKFQYNVYGRTMKLTDGALRSCLNKVHGLACNSLYANKSLCVRFGPRYTM